MSTHSASMSSAIMLALVACFLSVTQALNPTLWSDPTKEKFVPDSYQIILKNGISETSAAQHYEWLDPLILRAESQRKTELRKRSGNDASSADVTKFRGVIHSWDLGDQFRGYYLHTNDNFILNQIREHSDVEIVEPEPYYYANSGSWDNNDPIDQFDEPWGLGRISHQGHENSSWPYSFSYPGQGYGVDVYVLDTGIFAQHEDFEDRVVDGHSVVPDEDTVVDFNGHGTHCAGTIAGKTFGVAKRATIIPVKVLSQHATGGGHLLSKGMQWVRLRHLERVKSGDPNFRGSVVSMSLGAEKDTVVNRWATVLAREGIHLVAAAGNEMTDACTKSPASSPNVTTVAAIDKNDSFADHFSNFGSCVNIHGPGVDIISAGHTDSTANFTASGSSMACPHVAGVIATLLSRQAVRDDAIGSRSLTTITPRQMQADLLRITTKNVIAKDKLPADTTNAIVYSGGSSTNYAEIISRGGWPECCI